MDLDGRSTFRDVPDNTLGDRVQVVIVRRARRVMQILGGAKLFESMRHEPSFAVAVDCFNSRLWQRATLLVHADANSGVERGEGASDG